MVGLSPSPAPPEIWGGSQGGGAAQLLPRRSSTGQGGDSRPSAPYASHRCSPLSSPAKPGSSQPPPSRPDRLCGSSSVPRCLSLHSPSGHWAPVWPGASLPPLTQRGWCGGGRPGPPRWRCWPRGERPHPASGPGEDGGTEPCPVPCAQGEHLPTPLADLPGQHQQEHQPVQHRSGHALPQHQPAGHQTQPGTRPRSCHGAATQPSLPRGRGDTNSQGPLSPKGVRLEMFVPRALHALLLGLRVVLGRLWGGSGRPPCWGQLPALALVRW